MSEPTPAAEPQQTEPQQAEPSGDGNEPKPYTPPASQAELDRIISAAVARTHKKYGMTPDEARAAKAEAEQARTANQTEAERLTADLNRWQTEAETWRKAAVGSRIEAIAASTFADPSDAVAALADKNYLDAGGQIDTAAIQADLEDVLSRKPHWRKPDGAPSAPRIPAPNHAQGSSAGGATSNDPAAQFAAIVRSRIGSG